MKIRRSKFKIQKIKFKPIKLDNANKNLSYIVNLKKRIKMKPKM